MSDDLLITVNNIIVELEQLKQAVKELEEKLRG